MGRLLAESITAKVNMAKVKVSRQRGRRRQAIENR